MEVIHVAGNVHQSGGEHKEVVGEDKKERWYLKRSPEWEMES